ncbi:hypothetical protein PoB_005155600 [Plakobranchus ocellatus]|uniref:Uncharacterized protein n=1 Tax=Plakobranchus ocellatus TaxID=259542 RepID=A0AAV4C109_9GAST|nr:hypothetical protein PoB_005155600 [Plakobranchus ocellatus]
MDAVRKAVGAQWQRKVQDRRKWKTSAEGYILQWIDKASKKQAADCAATDQSESDYVTGIPPGRGDGREGMGTVKGVPCLV